MLSPRLILSTLQNVIEKYYSVPLAQKNAKHSLLLTIDKLIPLMKHDKNELGLYSNRMSEVSRKIHNLRKNEGESMLDVTIYRNTKDPYHCVISAECEAWPSETLEKTSGSETSDYLWDFYKLLQVPSDNRIFLGRITRFHRNSELDRVLLLHDKIRELITLYNRRCLREGECVFAIVLPTAGRHYSSVECRGYKKADGKIVELRTAKWTAD